MTNITKKLLLAVLTFAMILTALPGQALLAQRPAFVYSAPPSAAVSNGVYRIQHIASGLVLDVSNGSTANNARLLLRPVSNSQSQQFRLERQANSSYRIVAVHSGLTVGARDASAASRAQVTQANNQNFHAQRWMLYFNAAGNFFEIVNAYSGLALDVGMGLNGTYAQQYRRHSVAGQRFFLVPVTQATPTPTQPYANWTREQLANEILARHNNRRLTLCNIMGYPNTSLRAIRDTANGRRTPVGRAGTTVELHMDLLRSILILSDHYTGIRVSSITGLSRTSGSNHYHGRAFDIDMWNGRLVNQQPRRWNDMAQILRNNGITVNTYASGYTGASTHKHFWVGR